VDASEAWESIHLHQNQIIIHDNSFVIDRQLHNFLRCSSSDLTLRVSAPTLQHDFRPSSQQHSRSLVALRHRSGLRYRQVLG
jgi:hypothetical protein